MSALRVEDPRLLTGRGVFMSDVEVPGMLHATFVRSTVAHGRLGHIERSEAEAVSGVVAVLVAADLPPVTLEDRNRIPGLRKTPQPVIARDRARFVGEAVAMVVAETRYLAEDAAERVDVQYDPLPVTVVADERTGDADVPLFDDLPDNVIYRDRASFGDPEGAFARAEHVFTSVYRANRYVAVPLETRGCLANYDPASRRLEFWSPTQAPHLLRRRLAHATGLPEHHVRVRVPDVGGAFGQKIPAQPEEIAVALTAIRLGQPVKWMEDRRENLIAAPHAKQQTIHLELATTSSGEFLALRGRFYGDAGAYSFNSSSALIEPYLAAKMLPGPYRVEHYSYEVCSRLTNKSPIAPYRGVGWTAAQTARELLVDVAARGLGMDPVALRERNMVPCDAFPYRSCTGLVYDSGSYRQSLLRVAEIADYEAFRARQRGLREDGRLIGIGFSPYVEPTGWGTEGMNQMGWWAIPSNDCARISMDASGKLTVSSGTASQGQGHETSMAQIAAEVIGVPMSDAILIAEDTGATPIGAGTRASRSTVVGGGAIATAARGLRDKILDVAAAALELDPADLEIREGVVQPRGVPAQGMTMKEVAEAAFYSERVRERVPEPELSCTRFYDPKATYSNGCIAAIVEIDPDTGGVTVRRIVGVEDCGTVVNPMLVKGQFIGGVAQGLGGALLEQIVYDDKGQILTSTLMDYLLPTAAEMPPVELDHFCSPSPHTWNGVKGMAESGAIGAPAAIANAVADAVAGEGRIEALPLTAERILQLIDRG